jgi:hypothetical protein
MRRKKEEIGKLRRPRPEVRDIYTGTDLVSGWACIDILLDNKGRIGVAVPPAARIISGGSKRPTSKESIQR